jgi:hypothetical protein
VAASAQLSDRPVLSSPATSISAASTSSLLSSVASLSSGASHASASFASSGAVSGPNSPATLSAVPNAVLAAGSGGCETPASPSVIVGGTPVKEGSGLMALKSALSRAGNLSMFKPAAGKAQHDVVSSEGSGGLHLQGSTVDLLRDLEETLPPSPSPPQGPQHHRASSEASASSVSDLATDSGAVQATPDSTPSSSPVPMRSPLASPAHAVPFAVALSSDRLGETLHTPVQVAARSAMPTAFVLLPPPGDGGAAGEEIKAAAAADVVLEKDGQALRGAAEPAKEEATPRPHLRQLLEDFRNAGQIALKDIRCYSGLGVVLQIDIFTWVLMPLVPGAPESEEGRKACARLAGYLCEYIRSLQQFLIPIERYVFELLAWLLITCRREPALQLLLQYHVPTDSKRLARTLLEASHWHEPFMQVALDMFLRLGCIDQIVRAMLERGRLLPALQVLRKHPHFLRQQLHPHRRQQELEEPVAPAQPAGGALSFMLAGNRASSSQSLAAAAAAAPSTQHADAATRSQLPPGALLIEPEELLACAARLCRRPGVAPAPFVALHSFLVSADPWVIRAASHDSAGVAPAQPAAPSPLARAAGDALFEQVSFPDRETLDAVKRAYGYVV